MNAAKILRICRAIAAITLVVVVAWAVVWPITSMLAIVVNAAAVALLTLALFLETKAIRRIEHANRPRPDYSAIARMEREVYGETFQHDGAQPAKRARCYCDWCRGRAGVHGAAATALYQAQVAALAARHGKAP